MTAMLLDKWVPFRSENTVVRCRVFAFPHAAGSAAFYRPLRRFMPPEVDFCPVELPGRAARLDEPALTSITALIERLQDALGSLLAVPFGFFGHSVGACVAYEAARQIRSADGRSAVHLFVSSRGSPNRTPADPARTFPRSDHDLLAILSRFGGTPAPVMQRPELIAALLPALKADLELVEGYAVDPGSCIPCPITAFAGADDVSDSGSLRSWNTFTRRDFRTCTFPGRHFYFLSAAEPLVTEIMRDLYACVDIRPAAAGSRI
jgi:medium-chain acyl-[acyl-carrier-protein] hydrolase